MRRLHMISTRTQWNYKNNFENMYIHELSLWKYVHMQIFEFWYNKLKTSPKYPTTKIDKSPQPPSMKYLILGSKRYKTYYK